MDNILKKQNSKAQHTMKNLKIYIIILLGIVCISAITYCNLIKKQNRRTQQSTKAKKINYYKIEEYNSPEKFDTILNKDIPPDADLKFVQKYLTTHFKEIGTEVYFYDVTEREKGPKYIQGTIKLADTPYWNFWYGKNHYFLYRIKFDKKNKLEEIKVGFTILGKF